jgi:F-type H+-transporting ATPase subunit gamma
MTERLADINARVNGIHQLGSVVNAMRGIAGARAQQARAQLTAVDRYAAIIAQAIGRVFTPAVPRRPGRERIAAVVFCAEQGFAGAFSEHVLDALPSGAEIFLIGTRGATIAAERGINPHWSNAMPSASVGIPGLARRIAEALYARMAEGEIDRLDAVFSQWRTGGGMQVERQILFPLDPTAFPEQAPGNTPLLNLAPQALLGDLTADYVHAQLCHAALHSFAAENEARMAAMAAARHQIDQQLAKLELTQRIVRQEEITAEIIELATGEMAGQSP